MKRTSHSGGRSGTNDLIGLGCFKRMKGHIIEHVEMMRGTMFRAAARKSESALRSTFDELESEIENKVEEAVALIHKDYSALLTGQNIFQALSTFRDRVRNLLAQVDGRFEKVLRPQVPVEAAVVKREETPDMGIEHEEPLALPSLIRSASGTWALADARTGMADDDPEPIETKPSSSAPDGDVPMPDA